MDFHYANDTDDMVSYETINGMVRKLRRAEKISNDYSPLEVAVFGDDFELAIHILEYPNASDFGISDIYINRLLCDVIGQIDRSPWLVNYVDLLIEHGALHAEIDLPNGSGRTAFDESIMFNHVDVAECLIRAGANVNYIRDIGKLSPLMCAIQDRNAIESEIMANMLLDYGADIAYKTGWGMTVLDACTHKHRVNIMNRVISLNPHDTEGFKKALGWITGQLDQKPEYLRNASKPDTYRILRNAITNATR